jgi:hypothetical protein
MKELIAKISSYNLFNYLFPGVVFVALSNALTTYSFVQDNLLVAAFLYYFIGLVISRFGSLVVEPLLKKLHFLRFADYDDFVSASRSDPQIEVLSEANNTYRTLCSTFLLLLLLMLYDWLAQSLAFLRDSKTTVLLIVLLLVTFLFSYRKQTKYIKKRVDMNR